MGAGLWAPLYSVAGLLACCLAGLLAGSLSGLLAYWLAELWGSTWVASRGADVETGSPTRVEVHALEEALCGKYSRHWSALGRIISALGPHGIVEGMGGANDIWKGMLGPQCKAKTLKTYIYIYRSYLPIIW